MQNDYENLFTGNVNVKLQMMVKNLELELQHFKNHIVRLSTENQDLQATLEGVKTRNHQIDIMQQQQQNNEILHLKNQLTLLIKNNSNLENLKREAISVKEKLSSDLKNANESLNEKTNMIKQLKMQFKQKEQDLEKSNLESQSLEAIIEAQKSENKKLWDSMMFYRNKLEFPVADRYLEERITNLEIELQEEKKTKNDLMIENSHLKGPKDPDDCDICFQQLPLSRCLTANCEQIYHNHCIKAWFTGKNEYEKKCPKCKQCNVKVGMD